MVTNSRLSFIAILFFVTAGTALAAPKQKPERAEPEASRPSTLMGGVDEIGWYLAPTVSFTSIGGNTGLLFGGKGGVILDHKFVLGAAAYSFARDAFGTATPALTNFSYGGLFAEYILNPQDLFHISGGLLGAMGSASNESVFVISPQLNAIINLNEHVHLGTELNYRFVHTLMQNRPNRDWFSGLSVGAFIQFGNF